MSDQDPSEVAALTATFTAAELGDSVAAVELFGVLYRELHHVARRQLHANAPGIALGATTLLHEAYVNMASRGVRINDRSRFFAYAARAMRGLIIDHIREGRALKRGGEFHFTTLGTETLASVKQAAALGRLDEALSELAQADAQLAELVDLRFFAGFSFADIALMRGVSERTVQRDWRKARLYLHDVLLDD